MDNKYLWDRSGEPDAEIQQLEELLGTLRYQPQPLKIPQNVEITRRRLYVPPLAIAAGLLLCAIAVGFWINFKRRPTLAVTTAPKPEQKIVAPAVEPVAVASFVDHTPSPKPKPRQPAKLLLAKKVRIAPPDPPALTTEELAQKEQVLVALRLLSNKLSFAQRKTQSTPAVNLIHNQHKVG